MLTNIDATDPGQATGSDQQGDVQEQPADCDQDKQRWQAGSSGVPISESLLTVSNGMFLVQAALVIWWFLGIPLAVLTLLWGNGLALVCMGTVLLLLPRRLHFTKVHKQVDLTCLRVFLVAFTAYAVYYFWSFDG